MKKELEIWKTVGSKYLYKGEVGHKVRIDEVDDGSGKKKEYFVLEMKDNATILGLTQKRKVVLERTWRHPLQAEILELPVGGIEEGEDPLEAAKREFREETGYTSEDWTFLGSYINNDGYSAARSNLFLARNVVEGEIEDSEENKMIEVKLVDFEELKKWVIEGKIEDARTKMAVMLAVMKGLI